MGEKIVCRGCGGRNGEGCAIEPHVPSDAVGFYCPRDKKFYSLAEIEAINERVASSPVGLLMEESQIEGNEDRTEGTGRRGARSEESFKSFPKDSRTPTTPPQISDGRDSGASPEASRKSEG